MKVKDLKKLYLSQSGFCCKCGVSLKDMSGVGLGSIFILDKNGNFYCTNCDKDFVDGDERIFDLDLYEITNS